MELFGDIALHALIKKQIPREGDFYGSDGLLYCGKCKEPREKRFTENCNNKSLIGQIHPSMCKCEREADDHDQERIKKMTVNAEIDALRRNGLTDSLYTRFTFDDDKEYNPAIARVARNYADKFKELKY